MIYKVKKIDTDYFSREEYDNKLESLKRLVGLLDGDDKELVEKFINSGVFRVQLLDLLSEFEYHMIYSYIEFFTRYYY